MLNAVYKRFAEDLIRETCARIYFDCSQNIKTNETLTKKQTKNELNKKQTDTSLLTSQNQQQDGLEYQKFPQYLSVTDVFKTIQQHQKFDFLTNKNMAKLDN